MFWKKSGSGSQSAEKLPGPKDIPELVGRHLVVALKKDPDWVWRLKGAVRRRPESKDAYDFRVFDEAKAAEKKIKVRNYNHLSEHPDLILYAGWFDKKSMQVQLESEKKS
ncbi:MAG: hypothetical protein Q8O16_01280 [Dehalococcoidia bacterium]|nr:hypothetical protein [Dehalococcoidia bacterium]